jgi:quinone-modifying oxidoreductase, subunit QmoC
MSARIDANLMNELQQYGVGDWNACYHCGNCTASCPLTEQGFLFPRKGIRAMQMGLKDKLASSVEPWLCYYCGDCSETCPRDANPGEMMMSLRRYLTAVYDWTGISGKLYKSRNLHLLVVSVIFMAVIAAFLIFAVIPDLNSPEVAEYLKEQSTAVAPATVPLNLFAPPKLITLLDHLQLIFLSLFLVSNIFNMWYKVVLSDKTVKVPLWLYIKEAAVGFWHLMTQWRFKKCKNKKTYWFTHWLLMTSYMLMFSFIVLFLEWFQTDKIYSITHPQRWVGYYITFGLVFATVSYAISRIKKKEPVFKFTHHSDWIFLFLLFMIAVTGILIHFFRIGGMANATYYMYAIHLAFEVPMVFTFVAFSKWSHLAYRPAAIYFSNLKKSAAQQEAQAPAAAVTV